MNKAIFMWMSLACTSALHADLDKEIGKFFDNFNTTANNSSPEYINSQLGVHFLGGGATVRTSVYDVSPIHVQLPSFSAGCGGIDYTLGGINIASKDEMKAALKSIASNGVGYAFMLGIETVSPLVASTMKQIQTWANQLNAMNINSCDLGSSLVQGVWPKTQRASSFICEHASTSNPIFKDLIEARHGCREDKDKRQEAIKKVGENNQSILVGNYNIAWKALESSDLDEETRNLFMNITGTIVVRDTAKDGKEDKKVEIWAPNHRKAIDLLRFGGNTGDGSQPISTYKIADNKIDVKISPLVVTPENAWKAKVHKMLLSIQSKILNETRDQSQKLSSEEKNLINTTYFPIGSLLSVMTQYNGKGAILSLDRYSDLIAFERVLKFAEEVVRDTQSKAEALRYAQVSGTELDDYIKQIDGVLRDLQALNRENFQQISVEHQVINHLIEFDRKIREQERGF